MSETLENGSEESNSKQSHTNTEPVLKNDSEINNN